MLLDTVTCAWPICTSNPCSITTELVTLPVTALPAAIEAAAKEHLFPIDPTGE